MINTEFLLAAYTQPGQAAGLRFSARAVAEHIENVAAPLQEVCTPSGVYSRPGRGPNGESSN